MMEPMRSGGGYGGGEACRTVTKMTLSIFLVKRYLIPYVMVWLHSRDQLLQLVVDGFPLCLCGSRLC